jgi:hypothetical protein
MMAGVREIKSGYPRGTRAKKGWEPLPYTHLIARSTSDWTQTWDNPRFIKERGSAPPRQVKKLEY